MTQPPLAQIFTRFLRLGTTAFGGPAMIPYIRAMAVEREQWLDKQTFRLGMAMVQSLPGATAMQMAAYVGLRARGGLGAVAAYVGFGLPAFVLMLILTAIYASAQDVAVIQSAFAGLGVVVVALVANAALDFAHNYLDSAASWLMATAAGVWLAMRGNPILAMIVLCAISLFVFRQEQSNPFSGEQRQQVGNPLLTAGVMLGAFLLFLVTLWAISPFYGKLGLLMAKIDCFAFGGGYVSVPLMFHELVEVRAWLTSGQLMDGIALGQVTPGPIVITGTFAGYLLAGISGAVVATICVFTPSLIFVCAATPFADRLAASALARRALKGSLITLVGLMAAIAMRFGLSVHWGVAEVIIAGGAFIALRKGVDILKVVIVGSLISAILL